MGVIFRGSAVWNNDPIDSQAKTWKKIYNPLFAFCPWCCIIKAEFRVRVHSFVNSGSLLHLTKLSVLFSCLTYFFFCETCKNRTVCRTTRFQHCTPDWLSTAIKGQLFSSFSYSWWLPLPHLPFYVSKLASFDLLFSKSGTNCTMKLTSRPNFFNQNNLLLWKVEI